MMRYTLALFALVCGLWVADAYAATYYVDFAAGNDASAGTSTSTAWKHIPGTRNIGNTAWQQTSWGGGVISSTNKVPAGTVFKIKSGTTYTSAVGGIIWIDQNYYQAASASNYTVFQADQTWGGGGAVVFDGNGITISIALILIQQDGMKLDGVAADGIIIQNSPLCGIQVKEHSGTSNPILDTAFNNLALYNNGTNCTSSSECMGQGQLQVRRATGLSVQNVNLNGNGNHINGLLLGETHWAVKNSSGNATVTNCTSWNHVGLDPPNDAGIGFKAFNSQVTYLNCASHDNLKGWDLGEQSGDGQNINYKIINSQSYSNSYGMNMNSAAAAYAGTVNFYLINNIIRNNTQNGSNIYSGPYNLYAVHNVYAYNGTGGTSLNYFNLGVTPNSGDTQTVRAYLYNNIFYKPGAGSGAENLMNKYWDAVSGDYTLDSDYNSWIQNGSEYAVRWGGFAGSTCSTAFSYGTNGPGRTGNWYSFYDCSTTAPARSLGHYHSDSHSKGTGAADATEPSFANKAVNDYRLTAHYSGVNLTTKPWYIPEMGTDRSGNLRTSWDMGAYEFKLIPPTMR